MVAQEIEMATSLWPRFVGLMGRRELPAGHALYIKPCSSIHMFFMRFAIDAVFLDRDGRVLRIHHTIKPWRITSVVRKAKSCLELPAGTCGVHGLRVGEILRISDHPASAAAPPSGTPR